MLEGHDVTGAVGAGVFDAVGFVEDEEGGVCLKERLKECPLGTGLKGFVVEGEDDEGVGGCARSVPSLFKSRTHVRGIVMSFDRNFHMLGYLAQNPVLLDAIRGYYYQSPDVPRVIEEHRVVEDGFAFTSAHLPEQGLGFALKVCALGGLVFVISRHCN